MKETSKSGGRVVEGSCRRGGGDMKEWRMFTNC